ncbi:YSIRK-type signal peptide-containing protein [Lactobacillus crispatus]|uniref:YSIRK-type signal peptide-containing protein n=1 Tax=Lactobacillus crispatus TaxID=47770 RepID=UPI001E2D5DA8|nr:YSIRK-type signal peptide-containing protein [Lactobacillus crispatus]
MNKEIRPKYTLRKLSVGLASVMIGSTILLSSQQVHAADTSTTNTETTDVKIQILIVIDRLSQMALVKMLHLKLKLQIKVHKIQSMVNCNQ